MFKKGEQAGLEPGFTTVTALIEAMIKSTGWFSRQPTAALSARRRPGEETRDPDL